MTIASTSSAVDHPTAGSQLVRSWQSTGDEIARLVLVHGLAEHSGRYEHVGSSFAEAGIGVVAPDLVGFGATGGHRGHIDDWAIYLDQVGSHVETARTGNAPVVLLGHSLGGLIALEYVLSERAAPDLLVLSAPSLAGGAAWQKMLAPALAAVLPKLSVPNAIKGEQLSRDPAVGEAYFADPLVLKGSTAKLGSEIFAAMARVNATLDRLDVPTFVIHGGADSVVPATSTVELGGASTVERRLYPSLRHESFNEPEGPEVLADVVDWIKGRL